MWAATGDTTGDTELFIHGDYPFRLVDRLLTNFHVPRSPCSHWSGLAGPGWPALYATALGEGYRFLSFGDAMLVDRGALPVAAPDAGVRR
jgi:S-adenosylmethionine:tRNA ribosyltransferase-isomerase